MENSKTIPVMSSKLCYPTQSTKAILPMALLPTFGSAMDRFVESIPNDPYDQYGIEIEGEARLMPDDLDFDSPLGQECESMMLRLTTFPFELQNFDKVPDDSKKAMNVHYITGLNLALRHVPSHANVLILCGGNGEDATRLTHKAVPDYANLDIIGASPLRPLSKHSIKQLGARTRVRSEYLENIPPDFFLPHYDLILVHHGLHHIMKSPAGVAALQSVVSRLSPNGLLIGDKIDIEGLDTLSGSFSYSPSHGVEWVGYDRSQFMEGSVQIRVGNKVWRDPILSDKRMYDAFPGYNVHVLQGLGAFRGAYNTYGDLFTPPSTIYSASKRSECRIMTYVEIRKTMIPDSPNPTIHVPYIPSLQKKEALPGHVIDQMDFRVNKGKHFQVSDIPFLGGNTLFSRKDDGISSRVIVGEGSIYVKVDTNPPTFYVGQGKTRVGSPILRLQCEYIDGRLVLLDPIHLGVDTPSGFYARLQYYDSMVRMSPWIGDYIERKLWSPDIPGHLAYSEGVVMMGASCPSPFKSEKYASTARYSKWVNTVDVIREDGDIWEVNANTNEPIRPRPDKSKPNDPNNIRAVRTAITLDQLIAIRGIEYDPIVENSDLLEIATATSIIPLPGVLMALKYPNRPCASMSAAWVKRQLLENVGYHNPEVRSDYISPTFPLVTDGGGWMQDIGVEGGNGNSKGDGPPIRKRGRASPSLVSRVNEDSRLLSPPSEFYNGPDNVLTAIYRKVRPASADPFRFLWYAHYGNMAPAVPRLPDPIHWGYFRAFVYHGVLTPHISKGMEIGPLAAGNTCRYGVTGIIWGPTNQEYGVFCVRDDRQMVCPTYMYVPIGWLSPLF